MILRHRTGIERQVRAPAEAISSLDLGKETWENNNTICLVEVTPDSVEHFTEEGRRIEACEANNYITSSLMERRKETLLDSPPMESLKHLFSQWEMYGPDCSYNVGAEAGYQ